MCMLALHHTLLVYHNIE